MDINKPIAIILTFIIGSYLQGQNTIGVISKYSDNQEYNLFYPYAQSDVYLVDNCGEIINQWASDASFRPGVAAHLLQNGDIAICKTLTSTNDILTSEGEGGFIDIMSWNNTLKNRFQLNDAKARLHHDIKVLPNGNVLAIAWEYKTQDEAIKNGRKSTLITEKTLWPDYLLEINTAKNEVVWEWHAWDHLIQNADNSKQNFGKIEDHPELIDINHVYNSGQADWMHSNSLDYNEELDLIALSVPHFNEVWIIDHSTSKFQAASHTGGNFGKGGDLLYRWGNPKAYNKGSLTNQKLFYQHDVRWITAGKHKGSISVFNNRFTSTTSSFSIFKPNIDLVRKQFLAINGVYEPLNYSDNFLHPKDPKKGKANNLSSFQVLPNGTYSVLVGTIGYSFVFDESGKLLWEYIVPFSRGRIMGQGAPVTVTDNLVYKLEKYSANFSGFIGKDLSPKGYLEFNSKEICIVTDVNDQKTEETLIRNNISNQIQLFKPLDQNKLSILNISGQDFKVDISDPLTINCNDLPNGIYFLKYKEKVEKFVVMK